MSAERPISDKPEPKLIVDLRFGLIEEQLETGISPEISQNFPKVGWDFRVCYEESDNIRTYNSIPKTLIPEGNKSRVSGDGLESNRPTSNFP